MSATTRDALQTWSTEEELSLLHLDRNGRDDSPCRGLAEPERRLLLAVLVDAILRVQRRATLPPGPRRRELHEAEQWLRSNDRTWACSFVNVCEALELAPAPLRRAVLSGCTIDVAQMTSRDLTRPQPWRPRASTATARVLRSRMQGRPARLAVAATRDSVPRS